jgi:exosortase/archaeosortase
MLKIWNKNLVPLSEEWFSQQSALMGTLMYAPDVIIDAGYNFHLFKYEVKLILTPTIHSSISVCQNLEELSVCDA